MDLEIRYEHGSMTVHLEEFLSMRSISKVRKLLKIIRCSYTPECEQQMKEFVQEQIEQYEPKQRENNIFITGYEQKVRYCEQQLKDVVYARDGQRKNSVLWKLYNEKVKEIRVELSELKKSLNFYRSKYDQNVKNRDFYKKVLDNIT